MKFGFIERQKFEKIFDMWSGYVLNFSDRTFQAFIADSILINIDDWSYLSYWTSKANRMRGFWDKASDFKIWKLLSDLLEYAKEENLIEWKESLYDACYYIATQLKSGSDIDALEIQNIENSKTMDLLLEEIKSWIQKETPEVILDRLHTLCTKFIKWISKEYWIPTEGKTLNAIFWMYIKKIKEEGVIESELSEKLFKSNISILEDFNYIRNNKSLAHDNTILNSNESLLIIKNIINLIEFLDLIESEKKKKQDESISIKDIPF